jgi:hypothetical protein
MKSVIEKFKEQWEKDPVSTTIVTAMALTAVSKFISVLSEVEGRHAYAKQVKNQTRRQRRGQL